MSNQISGSGSESTSTNGGVDIKVFQYGDWKDLAVVLADAQIDDVDCDSNAHDVGSLIIKTVAALQVKIDKEIEINKKLLRLSEKATEFDVSVIVLVSAHAVATEKITNETSGG